VTYGRGSANGALARVWSNGALDSANRAATLTHRLLAFSRRQPVDPRPVDLNQLIENVEELLRRSLGENIDLSIARGRIFGSRVATRINSKTRC